MAPDGSSVCSLWCALTLSPSSADSSSRSSWISGVGFMPAEGADHDCLMAWLCTDCGSLSFTSVSLWSRSDWVLHPLANENIQGPGSLCGYRGFPRTKAWLWAEGWNWLRSSAGSWSLPEHDIVVPSWARFAECRDECCFRVSIDVVKRHEQSSLGRKESIWLLLP